MIFLFTAVHIVVCVFLILVVLLQQGKSQDFSSTFGGGGTQASFGARSGATLLTKATTVSAIVFMLTSMTLTIMMTNQGSTSVIDEGAIPAAAEPANDGAVAPEEAAPAAGDDVTGGEPTVPEPDAGAEPDNE